MERKGVAIERYAIEGEADYSRLVHSRLVHSRLNRARLGYARLRGFHMASYLDAAGDKCFAIESYGAGDAGGEWVAGMNAGENERALEEYGDEGAGGQGAGWTDALKRRGGVGFGVQRKTWVGASIGKVAGILLEGKGLVGGGSGY